MLALCRLRRSTPGGTPRRWRRRRGRRRGACRWKTGLSSVPSPWAGSTTSGRRRPGDRLDQRRVVDGGDQVVVGHRGGDVTRSWSRTPSSRASRMVRSTRIGDIGWLGPKSYSVRRRVEDHGRRTRARWHAGARYRYVWHWARAHDSQSSAGGPPDGGPRSSTPSFPRPPTGGRSVVSGASARGPSTTQEHTMDRTLSLLTPTGRLTLGNLPRRAARRWRRTAAPTTASSASPTCTR